MSLILSVVCMPRWLNQAELAAAADAADAAQSLSISPELLPLSDASAALF